MQRKARAHGLTRRHGRHRVALVLMSLPGGLAPQDKLIDRDFEGAQAPLGLTHDPGQLLPHRPALGQAAGGAQTIQQLSLDALNVRGLIAPADLDPPVFQLAVLEATEVAIRHRHIGVLARGQKDDPSIASLDGNGEIGGAIDRLAERLDLRCAALASWRRRGPGPLDPNAIHNGVDHAETMLLADFARRDQFLARESANRLMGLDPPESRVAIAQVTEAANQKPLQRALPPVVAVALLGLPGPARILHEPL